MLYKNTPATNFQNENLGPISKKHSISPVA